MHLFKSGNKYYLSRIGTKNYLWDDDYIIENGQLKWCHPKIKLIRTGGISTYIQTSYKANTNTVVILEYSFESEPEPNSSERYKLIKNNGSYNSSSHPNAFNYSWWRNSASGYASWFYVGTSGGAQSYSLQLASNNRYQAIISGTIGIHQKLTDLTAGTVLQDINNTWSFDGSATGGLKIFADETGNSVQYSIYYVKFIENDQILYHFVPVPTGLQIGSFTVPSNGMFDIVNQQFYANQGSGTFTYGKDS